MALPAYSFTIVDTGGNIHTITSDVQSLEISTEISDAAGRFSFEISNVGDAYSYLEKGCWVMLHSGMGSTTKKLEGAITDVRKTLVSGISPVIQVSGESLEGRLNQIYFSGRFYNMEVSALLHAIMSSTDYTTGKTYYDLAWLANSSMMLSSTIYTISEASYSWKSLGSIIKELAEAVGFAYKCQPQSLWNFLKFYDPATTTIVDTITDDDLEGTPTITNVGDIVNRVIVVGGYEQVEDKSGNTQTTTTTVTSSTAKNQSFVPAQNYVGSVLVYTDLVTGSTSDITLSIQEDSAAAPDGTNISNGQQTVEMTHIVDGGYTEFRFDQQVTLTPGSTYWLVLEGTTANGVKVGVDGSAVLDYSTRYPVRVAVMVSNDASYDKYGMYTHVLRDAKIEDPQYAEVLANGLLMAEPKQRVTLKVKGDSLKAGDLVQLTLTTVGIAIDKTMKVLHSTQTLGDIFIYNSLEIEEV